MHHTHANDSGCCPEAAASVDRESHCSHGHSHHKPSPVRDETPQPGHECHGEHHHSFARTEITPEPLELELLGFTCLELAPEPYSVQPASNSLHGLTPALDVAPPGLRRHLVLEVLLV